MSIAVLAACDSDEAGPRGDVLIGVWGGSSTQLIATDTGATLRQSCSETVITSLLEIDGHGEFAALGIRSALGGARPREFERSATVTVRGKQILHDDTILRVSIRRDGASDDEDPVLLRRGVTVEYLPCPL